MKSTTSDPLLQAWEKTLATENDRPAIFAPDQTVFRSFREVEEESRCFERDLLPKLPKNGVLAVQIGNHPSWPALLLAALRCDLITLPLEQSITEPQRLVALEICQASALIQATDPAPAKKRSVTLQLLSHRPIEWGSNPPVLLKLTSGTTAAPRAIRFRSEQLLADCLQICQTMNITPADLNFAVIPLSHSYGFSNLVTPILARGVPMVLSSDRMPRAVLDHLASSRATVFPATPAFYQAFAEINDPPALPNLRLCISAGAPLSLKVARAFLAKFQHSIHSFYGSSECGGICFDREASLTEEGFVGSPMSGLQLEMLNPTSDSTQVRVRSPAVADGYFPNLDNEKLGHGQFVPDDLLTAVGDGFLLVGRVSDVINVAGKKVNPAEVEAELLQFAGVRAAIVFGRESSHRNEEVAACVVTTGKVGEMDLLNHCRARLSGWQVPKRIFFVDEIPTTERGKVSRRELAAQFRT